MNQPTGKYKILVPIDFSDITDNSLKQALNFAKIINGEITLINVMEDYGFFNKYISKKEQKDINVRIEKQLNEIADVKSSELGIKINTIVTKGKIYSKIVETAEMIKATFILMGTSGSMGIMKFIGSNTLRVIRESKIPVISFLGSKSPEGCKNIILPLDLTKETKEKVSKAIWISKLYTGSVIRAVSVLATTDEFIVHRIKGQMKQVKAFIKNKGIECTSEIITKDKSGKSLAKSIIEYAKKVDGDIIVIMTQQETDITELFIGSAAQEIINNSEIPVMSVVPSD
ncbi:MAG: universal stress protein [Bacteroidota bacterium]